MDLVATGALKPKDGVTLPVSEKGGTSEEGDTSEDEADATPIRVFMTVGEKIVADCQDVVVKLMPDSTFLALASALVEVVHEKRNNIVFKHEGFIMHPLAQIGHHVVHDCVLTVEFHDLDKPNRLLL